MRFLLFLATATVLAAQPAPASLVNKQVMFTIESGTGGFASYGVGVRVFSSGSFYTTQAVGFTPSSGTYTYSKASASVAVLKSSDEGFQYTCTLSFLTPEIGTYVNTAGGDTQTGTFVVVNATKPPLVNMSTRTVLTAGQELRPGFVVDGPIPRRVLIRAIGPGLAQFGATGLLETPVLTVFRGQTEIARNSGWGGSKTLSDAFAATGAFGLAANSKDAAVLLTLAPDAYTAVLSGGAGDVLLEVYFVD